MGPGTINSSNPYLKHKLEDFVFTRFRPALPNNNVGRLIRGTVPKGPVATGMDIAYFENGKITALYVFLDAN